MHASDISGKRRFLQEAAINASVSQESDKIAEAEGVGMLDKIKQAT